jgi:hypothetical protein
VRSLGDERPCATSNWYSVDYDSQKPDLVFEFHYHSTAMLQAMEIIPPPKREAPQAIGVEDEEILPPPKRQKTAHNEDLVHSMQVRSSWNLAPVPSHNVSFCLNRRSWNGCGIE